MYTSLSIKNFRAFETLEIEGLKRVNLFTGRNNSGKTSVLEAVYLLEGDDPAPRACQLFRNRGLSESGIVHQAEIDMPWATLFRELNVKEDIRLVATAPTGSRIAVLSTNVSKVDRDQIQHYFKFTASDRIRNVLIGHNDSNKPDSAKWIGVSLETNEQVGGLDADLNLGSFLLSTVRRSQRDLVVQYGRYEVMKNDALVLEALQLIEPRLQGLSTILSGGAPILHVDLSGGTRRLPLTVVGDAMLRLLDIVFAILQNSGRAVMIDEIENGFHYSVLPKVWELIHKLAKQYNVQVFAVTHSHECAVAAHKAANTADYDYGYFRIEQKDGIGRAVAYSHEQMQTSIEANLEVR
jgi:predicted ATP-dependent endonuclease of OLD family